MHRRGEPTASASSSRGAATASARPQASTVARKKLAVGEPVWVKPESETSDSRNSTPAKRSASRSIAASPAQAAVSAAPPRRGKVQRLRSSGAIDIYYENGEVEERVVAHRISAVTKKEPASKPKPTKQLVLETTPREAADPPAPATATQEPARVLFASSATKNEEPLGRRARTADGSNARPSDRATHRSVPQSAGGGARPSNGTAYVDMSEVLAANQLKVVELLEAIRNKHDDATVVVRSLKCHCLYRWP
jgi:hypothetical protein